MDDEVGKGGGDLIISLVGGVHEVVGDGDTVGTSLFIIGVDSGLLTIKCSSCIRTSVPVDCFSTSVFY